MPDGINQVMNTLPTGKRHQVEITTSAFLKSHLSSPTHKVTKATSHGIIQTAPPFP